MAESENTSYTEILDFEALSTGSQKPESDVISPDGECSCLLCEQKYNLPGQQEEFEKHLLLSHKLLIGKADAISNFRSYIHYWHKRFKESPITDFCSVVVTNTGPNDTAPQEDYYMLADVIDEDRELRHKLQRCHLKQVIEQQQRERNEGDFSHKCLFCTTCIAGNRNDLFNHMSEKHNFHIGHADNIVYCKELLDVLEKKLDSLQCLYCEKIFKDHGTLKEHMRKKQHKRIHPNNKSYDKYYLINYLEAGKTWQEVQEELDEPSTRAPVSCDDKDYEDWTEENEQCSVCLFCTFSSDSDKVMSHMTDSHRFDLRNLTLDMKLSFYDQVKLVNYIRCQMHSCQCIHCNEEFQVKEELLKHMDEQHDMLFPAKSLWSDPQYYFPKYENDRLLCALLDSDEDSGEISQIIAEDTINPKEIEAKRAEIMKELQRV